MQENTIKTWLRADDGELSKVIEYPSGAKVVIPVNKDGSVKWFDDSRLLRAKSEK